MTTPTAAHRAAQANLRVLLVDDEASIREAIGRFLRTRGFDVHVADTVATGLDRLRSTRFAALICDVRMPGASGMDLIPEALKTDADLAILMLTGLNDAAVATEALELGAADYLLKPVELAHLEKSLARALSLRDARVAQRTMEQRVRDDVARLAARADRATPEDVTAVLSDVLAAFDSRKAQRQGKSK